MAGHRPHPIGQAVATAPGFQQASQPIDPPARRRFATAGALLVAALLSACAPGVPRFGNYGGAPTGAVERQSLPPDPCAVARPEAICWTPVQARFHPDGRRLVVNLCNNRRGTPQDQYFGGIHYCCMVEYMLEDQRWLFLPELLQLSQF